jgi:hypothetical protein
MSLATLKKKTEEKYKVASAHRLSYSVNGPNRNEGFGPYAAYINNTNAPSVVDNINRKFHNNAHYNHFKSTNTVQSQSSRLERLKKTIPFVSVKSTNFNPNNCKLSTTKDVSIMSNSEYLQKRSFQNKNTDINAAIRTGTGSGTNCKTYSNSNSSVSYK